MSAKVEPGTYQCQTTAATIKTYTKPGKSGECVMCRIGIDLGLTGGICLIQYDGTLSEEAFRNVATILDLPMPWQWEAWDGKDPEDFAGHDVEAVVETIQGENGEFSSVKYLNVPGGAKMQPADAKSLAAKYGAKTRALFGGTPAKPAAPKPKPKAPPPKPAGQAATMEAVYEAWLKGTDNQADEAWWAFAESATGKDQNDCTPEDWGKAMAAVPANASPDEDNLPF